jgi:hypothetical protein
VRGVAVVVMVAAHVIDAWTQEADRHDDRYFNTVFINGLAAPLFLLLAGLALAMAAESRARRVGAVEAAGAARQRGWQVFGLAFLFRLQSQLLGWGPLINLLKVDILNVMGPAMVLSGALWQAGRSRLGRITLFALATLALAFLTPLVRETSWLDPLPDPIEWYLRPAPNRSTFTIFSWAGFLTAGALIGELVDGARRPGAERVLHAGLLAGALSIATAGYLASFLPSIYANAQFWTSSPTFFFIRLGIVVALLPLAWVVNLRWEPLVTLGRSSLFVYWIHVEMAYGGLAIPLKRNLPWEASLVAAGLLCVVLYYLVLAKNRWLERRPLPSSLAFVAPILK